jgi:hypothetical protein
LIKEVDVKNIIGYAFMLIMLTATCAVAEEARGILTANGQTAQLRYAVAYETDSFTDPGYMDVVVVISDRKLPEKPTPTREQLEEMSKGLGLVGLRVVLNSDARVMSAEPMHPAFKTFPSSPLWIKWTPSAYEEKKIGGRFYTDKMINELEQSWQYDVTFSVPIQIDPEAQTNPKK